MSTACASPCSTTERSITINARHEKARNESQLDQGLQRDGGKLRPAPLNGQGFTSETIQALDPRLIHSVEGFRLPLRRLQGLRRHRPVPRRLSRAPPGWGLRAAGRRWRLGDFGAVCRLVSGILPSALSAPTSGPGPARHLRHAGHSAQYLPRQLRDGGGLAAGPLARYPRYSRRRLATPLPRGQRLQQQPVRSSGGEDSSAAAPTRFYLCHHSAGRLSKPLMKLYDHPQLIADRESATQNDRRSPTSASPS